MDMCETLSCSNTPIAICLHCKKQLCVEHILQHNEELIHQANVYCDEFNELTEEIENMSFDQQFTTAEEDLHDWINEQMKALDKIYEQKLFELKQKHSEVNEKLEFFKQNQRMKLKDIQHRLFNSQLNKQISIEQLNQMKTTIEQLQKDIQQFKTNQCTITLVNNDQKNYSYKPNINIQFNKVIIENVDSEDDKAKKSQLSADAQPFEYIPKHNSLSYSRQDDFPNRLFDRCAFFTSIQQSM